MYFPPSIRHNNNRLPRRIINAFPFNIEFDLLDVRLQEIGDVVDVFLILESNYTAYGRSKPLYLLDRLRNDSYAAYAKKIVHVFLDYFPVEAYSNGWIVDDLLRNYIVSKVMDWHVACYPTWLDSIMRPTIQKWPWLWMFVYCRVCWTR